MNENLHKMLHVNHTKDNFVHWATIFLKLVALNQFLVILDYRTVLLVYPPHFDLLRAHSMY